MPQLSETVLAPELDGGQWIQYGPVSIKALRDKAIVLVDFWDYTCINCIRTLPYVVAWNKRYARSGLLVVGVHAPEFSFAREGSHVTEAAARFGLEYSIVLDNEYAIWRAYSNRFWPAKYLVDAKGRIRYYHFGEGAYQETEVAIQGLIRELNPGASLPPPMEPVRDSDRPGAVCYRVTPELYLGHARGQFGNFAGVVRDQPHDYRDAGPHVEGMSYLAGRWRVEQESARSEAPGAAISLRYTAKDVNLVMTPPAGASVRAEVTLEGSQRAGDDVKFEGERGFVTVDRPRMYSLVANESVVSGALTIRAEVAGLAVYAFTFISCVVN
ncbi:MAG TPA: redoxin family protein [Candidatus Binatus sp.]|uniref:redoxin family protein n=1 Tax=Candidatus Binatus sp. TaxID=2811406 RepID=UPI002B472528|nr:redoxin family protein [Candidatus Binatus sp.]HKN12611.1 redoxin family protein [Candidatus Binatus sp.]